MDHVGNIRPEIVKCYWRTGHLYGGWWPQQFRANGWERTCELCGKIQRWDNRSVNDRPSNKSFVREIKEKWRSLQ